MRDDQRMAADKQALNEVVSYAGRNLCGIPAPIGSIPHVGARARRKDYVPRDRDISRREDALRDPFFYQRIEDFVEFLSESHNASAVLRSKGSEFSIGHRCFMRMMQIKGNEGLNGGMKSFSRRW